MDLAALLEIRSIKNVIKHDFIGAGATDVLIKRTDTLHNLK